MLSYIFKHKTYFIRFLRSFSSKREKGMKKLCEKSELSVRIQELV